MTNNHGRIIRIVSFGYGHGPAPDAEITLDLRRRFRNPHHDPAMKQLTGLDADVYAHVLATPGVRDLAAATALAAHDLAHAVPGPITVACGCVGGRHRSVGIARHIAAILADGCARIEVEHRDVHRSVLPSTAHAPTLTGLPRIVGPGPFVGSDCMARRHYDACRAERRRGCDCPCHHEDEGDAS
ncbi:RapZ C-terminal domain-containing protein [Embleya scabrispora]|uniref:RapZ C-terminal domain-containing protein n=1 Tax=Embleya scabrispora TaxID=159449 RepID=UPI001F252560|nr:RNase adapter RapZ [Embleya scabrispora]